MVFRHRLRCALFALLLASAGLLILASVAGAAPPDTVFYNPIVADVISEVTTPTLAYELEGLTGERPVTVAGISYTIATRNSLQSEAISMATRYAYEWLAETGLDVSYHEYSWGDHDGRNVVAEKPGLINPEEIYLITAHLDDMPPGPLAPGADDNASGSVTWPTRCVSCCSRARSTACWAAMPTPPIVPRVGRLFRVCSIST